MSKSHPQTASPKAKSSFPRTLPVGAEFQPKKGGTHFRVWAPGHRAIKVIFEDHRAPTSLRAERNGYFSGYGPDVAAGTKYKYEVDEKEAYPDPASRYQPDGPHGFSQIVDPGAFAWSDSSWPGVTLAHQVIYELHLGTFTSAGTWL